MSLVEEELSLRDDEYLFDEVALAERVLAAQDGDREAFGELVERFEPVVFSAALRRVGNAVEAEELAQEVFVQALRKIGQLRDPLCFGGWLRAITARLAINRAVRRRETPVLDPEALAASCREEETPDERAMARERRDQLHAALARLGALDRKTLEAFYLRGESLIEMSNAFAAPIGTIKRRLHVARKRLAAVLGETIGCEFAD